MKSSLLLVTSLAVLAAAIPHEKHQPRSSEHAAISDFHDYGSYGAYGSYNSYDTVKPDPAQNSGPAPPTGDPSKFVAVTTRSGDSLLHLKAISANGQRFYIGKETSTYCPQPDCSGFITFTAFTARPNDPTTGLSLLTSVPGGQATFITPEGELGFTQAHSGSMPQGSLTTPFLYSPETESGRVGSLIFNSGNWVACPVLGQTGIFQIYAQAAPQFTRQDCIGVGFTTAIYAGAPAWQYT